MAIDVLRYHGMAQALRLATQQGPGCKTPPLSVAVDARMSRVVGAAAGMITDVLKMEAGIGVGT